MNALVKGLLLFIYIVFISVVAQVLVALLGWTFVLILIILSIIAIDWRSAYLKEKRREGIG